MKTNKLTSTTLKIFGGSAIAGMGFALGRDVYKKLKKWYILLIILVAIFSLYTTGIWLARNYNHLLKSIFVRLGAFIFGIPSFVILFFCSFVLFANSDQTVSEDLAANLYSLILPSLVLSAGLVVGFIQRKKRQQIWQAESFNLNFLESTGLVEHEDGTIEDIQNLVNYKIDFAGKERVTLMPLGKRNKRAYIYIDEVGKYSNFTGLISV